MPKNNENVEQEQRNDLEVRQEQNEAWFEELTSKNQDYMVKLNRQLEDGGMPQERRTAIFNDMLKTIVSEQENHLTARKIYGTVTDQARYLLEGKGAAEGKNDEKSETWKLYLDGALLLGGLFAVISGISAFTSDEPVGMGIVTLILNFLLGGGAVLIITKYAPTPGVKGGFLKYILATTLTMVAWIFLMALGTAILPPVLNPVIPGEITLVIGLLAFLAKWYLKKKLDIKGTLI